MLYASYDKGGGRVVGGGWLIPWLFLCYATEKLRLISDGILLGQAGMIMNLKLYFKKYIFPATHCQKYLFMYCQSNCMTMAFSRYHVPKLHRKWHHSVINMNYSFTLHNYCPVTWICTVQYFEWWNRNSTPNIFYWDRCTYMYLFGKPVHYIK